MKSVLLLWLKIIILLFEADINLNFVWLLYKIFEHEFPSVSWSLQKCAVIWPRINIFDFTNLKFGISIFPAEQIENIGIFQGNCLKVFIFTENTTKCGEEFKERLKMTRNQVGLFVNSAYLSLVRKFSYFANFSLFYLQRY